MKNARTDEVDLHMRKIKVYRFKNYDIYKGQWFVSPRMATADAIPRFLGTRIPETETEIDESRVDGDGMAEIGFMPS